MIDLLSQLAQERQRLALRLRQVDDVLRTASPRLQGAPRIPRPPGPPRPSPLDQFQSVLLATAQLRLPSGNLSAERVAKLFGTSLSQLAGWLGRSRQAVSKTPAAESLQNDLAFFERVARMRAVMTPAQFRQWLRTPSDLLQNRSPLDLMAQGEWQLMADYVDDALAGAPT